LDRSIERKEYMVNILSNINIPNTRISATDGKNEKVREYILPQITNITDYEIACSLSHIKAISYLYELIVNENTINENNYYIVCEDDISLDNLILFNHDLKYIIENAPEFDILMIYKTFYKELGNLYSNWNNEFNKGAEDHIAGTGCYVISTNGIKNIYNFMSYKDEKFTINKTINVADKFIYKDFKTYTYKYNFIANKEESSTIHSEHIDWHVICSDRQLSFIIKDFLIK
jgi:GR25 family glycosyltransferase involved in LPS biosynthesis